MGAALSGTSARPKPPTILADYLDPETGDFASMIRTLDPVDAQVLIALSVKRGSGAAVTADGNELYKIKKILPSCARDVEAAVRNSLSRLVSNRDIDPPTVSVEVNKGSQSVEALISWYNRRSGTKPSVRLLVEV